MNEFISIISKDAVTAVPTGIALIGGIVPILLVVSTFVYWAIVKDAFKAAKYLGIVGSIALILSIAWMCISCMFFSQPTGEYHYKVTIDKDKITVAQYEEFISQYHPDIADGIYYFTAKEID